QREETPEVIRLSVPLIKEIINAYHIPILEVNGYEADDVIGTLALQAGNQGITTYMMTPDKDYAQLVTNNVFMYRPKYGDKEFEIMGIEEIKAKFDIQSPRQIIDLLGLMGDASDNIPGCPGVGEKTAKKLIAEFDTIDNLLKHTDELKGSLKVKIEENRELIILSKFLATIKTDVPIALNMDMLTHKNVDEKELLKIFEELEFKNLINRVFNKGNRTVTVSDQSNILQGDLFGFSSTENDAIGQNYANNHLIRLSSLDYDYQLIDDENKRKELLENLSTVEILSMDTETTGTDPMTAELVGMSFSYAENQAFYIPVPDDRDKTLEILNEFRTVFENENLLKVGQNIKYDMLVLRNYGIEVKGKLFDTMVAHYVLQPELRHGMDYLAEIYLNYRTIHIDELIGPKGKNQKNMRDIPPEDVYLYACEDADVTLKLKNILEKELEKNKIEPLFYELEIPLIPVLVYMENNGVRLDLDTLKESSLLFNERLKNIEQAIYQSAGESFNIASPKQVGEILFDKLKIMEKAKKTKTGQYTTSEEVLESLRYKHPVIQKILEHRGLKKLLNTYVDALPQLINPRTGKVHTSFNQTVTATGRLSSSNPNLQNIPIRDEDGKEMRKAFIPDDGCLFFSADYSQIELRIMAHLSEDKNMIDAFLSGYDIHAATAAKIYKIDVNDVNSDMRRKAKTANFGIIYGISVFGLADRMNVERQEAKNLIEGYFETYPEIKEYMNKAIKVARELGYVATIFHRKRYLPDINSQNSVVRGYAERNAINAPVQGSAADIIKVAMIRIYERFRVENIRAKMILQVHDELNFSVPVAEKEIVEKIVIEEMERAYEMKVPLKVDCGWGNNWLEAH
ncbi:DNA polymerase I, partial [termite gut metagenome]